MLNIRARNSLSMLHYYKNIIKYQITTIINIFNSELNSMKCKYKMKNQRFHANFQFVKFPHVNTTLIHRK